MTMRAMMMPPLPPVDEETARVHWGELCALARKHGVRDLRFASAGRLIGHRLPETTYFDIADFEIEAVELLGRELILFSDRVLTKPGVSPDLVAAKPL